MSIIIQMGYSPFSAAARPSTCKTVCFKKTPATIVQENIFKWGAVFSGLIKKNIQPPEAEIFDRNNKKEFEADTYANP